MQKKKKNMQYETIKYRQMAMVNYKTSLQDKRSIFNNNSPLKLRIEKIIEGHILGY